MKKDFDKGLNYDYTEFIEKAYDPSIERGYMPVKCFTERNFWSLLEYMESKGFRWRDGKNPTDNDIDLSNIGDNYVLGFKPDNLTIGLYTNYSEHVLTFSLTLDEFMMYENEDCNFQSSRNLDDFLNNLNIKG